MRVVNDPTNNLFSFVDVSIIIPTYNRPESLQKTIKSIFSYATIPNELIIVDQSDQICFEKNKELLSKYSNSFNVKIIHDKESNKSSSASRNKGIRYSNNDILLFLDDDICFHDDCLYAIYKFLSKDDIALIGGINCTDKLYMPSLLSRFAFGINKKIKNHGLLSKSMIGFFPSEIDTISSTEWAMGFCFAAKKHIIVQNDIWFDEKMSGYCYAEDLDFTYRYIKKAKESKKKSYFSNAFAIEHLVSKEHRTTNKKAALLFVFNRLYLMKKNNFPKINYFHYDLANRIFARQFRHCKENIKWFNTICKETRRVFRKPIETINFDFEYERLLNIL